MNDLRAAAGRVVDGEDCRGCADAERDGEQDRRGEATAPAQGAEGMAEVLKHALHEGKTVFQG